MSNRKIVYHVTKQYMKKNKRRTFTTFLGIVFMVMLMTCVFVGKDTALSYLECMTSMERGKWHAIVYHADAEKYRQIRALKQVEETAVSADCGYTEFLQSANEKRPFLQVKAYSKRCYDWMNIVLTEGRLPEREGELLLNEDVLADGAEIAVGDEISADFFLRMLERTAEEEGEASFPMFNLELTDGVPVEAPQGFPYYGENESFREYHTPTGKTAVYTVVGFMECPRFEKSGAAAYTALTFLDEGKELPETFQVSVLLDVKNARNYQQELVRIAENWENLEINNMLLAMSGNSTDNTINVLVNVMSVFFIVLIMAASVTLIYNVFNMSFEERSRYLGMLSSIGATGKQKRSSVYYEAFSLLLPALPAGFLVGLGVVKAGMLALKPYIDRLMSMAVSSQMRGVSLRISAVGVIATVLLCTITVAISAFLPANKISKVGPIECIRGNVSYKKRRFRMNRTVIRWFGAEGMLANNAVKREKKKTRGLIGAVVVFMVILIVITFSTKTITEMVDSLAGGRSTMSYDCDYDYAVAEDRTVEASAYQNFTAELKRNSEVEYALEWGTFGGGSAVPDAVYSTEYWNAYRAILAEYAVTDEEYEKLRSYFDVRGINVLAVDEDTMKQLVEKAGGEELYGTASECPPVLVVKEGEMSTQTIGYEGRKADYRFYKISNMTGLKRGEVMPVQIRGLDAANQLVSVPFPVTVAGFATEEMLEGVVEFHTETMVLIVGPEVAEKIEQAARSADLMLRFRRETLVKLAKKGGALDNYLMEQYQREMPEGIFVYKNREVTIYDIKSAVNSAIRILLFCFVLLTSVICLLNLYNSVRGRVSGRRREFAILRSVGMTERQMYRMLCIEAGEILLRSVAVAVLVSAPLVLLVDRMLIQIWGEIGAEFPWGVYGLSVLLAGAAVFGLTLLSYRMEKKENMLVDMRNESV